MPALDPVVPEPPAAFLSRKPRLEALNGRLSRKAAEADVSADAELMQRSLAKISPMHSLEGYASTLFVASVAGAWIAVASTVTLPLLAAGEMMARASRALAKA